MSSAPNNEFENSLVLAAQPITDRLVGLTVGEDYTIEKLIGHGSKGRIYVAYHKALEHKVAVKFLIEEPDDEHLTRFRQEAQALIKLKHHNIVSVRDFGYHDNRPFLVMDLVEGASLDAILTEQGKLNDAQARSIFLQTAAALEHAHGQGILHRDIKPANIMLVPLESDSGQFQVFIVDFGLAKIYSSDINATSLTQTGMMIGTPQYMSPEQCAGRELDPRSDIYSLGCVMYEVITGNRCVSSTTLFDCLYKQINELPPPFEDVESRKPLRSTLEDVVFKCLAKDPDKRYSSAKELHSVLLATNRSDDTAYETNMHRWWKRKNRKQQHSLGLQRISLPTMPLVPAMTLDRAVAAIIDALIVASLSEFWFGMVHVLARNSLANTSIDRMPAAHLLFPFLVADWFAGNLLFIPLMLFWSSTLTLDAKDPAQLWFGAKIVGGLYVYGAGCWIYRAACEASRGQATPGKLMLGLAVTDSNGTRLTFSRALLRTIARPLSLIIFVDLIRSLHASLYGGLKPSAALRRVLLVPAHDWISGCQVRCRDDSSAAANVHSALIASGLAFTFSVLGLWHFFVPWLLSILLTGIAIILWVGYVHRIFMIARARRPASRIWHPWLATAINIVGLCFVAIIQIATFFASHEKLNLSVPASIYGALRGKHETIIDEIVYAPSISHATTLYVQSGLNHFVVEWALPVIALCTLCVFLLYLGLFRKLASRDSTTLTTSTEASWQKDIPKGIAASLALTPLLRLTGLTQTHCLGLSLGFLLAFALLSKIDLKTSNKS